MTTKKDYEIKIDSAVRENYFVDKNNSIELYTDYRETGEFLLDTVYLNRNSGELEDLVRDEIWEAYLGVIEDSEEEIMKKAGVLGEDFEDAAYDYLRSTYSFDPPYGHFLSHEMKVNIMLATPEERNCEYTNIHDQYVAMVAPDSLVEPEKALEDRTMLSWLLEQQGHTMAELQATMKDYDAFFYDENGKELSLDGKLELFNKTHNAFLTSVCQELENQTYDMGVMTVLAKLSIKDFIEMQNGGKEITMPRDCMIGIYNPWNGSGSVLEIELEKPLAFSTDMFRDVQIEGVKPQFEYTVDDVYGLIGSCWKSPVSIESINRDEKEIVANRDEKPGLDTIIASAENQKQTVADASIDKGAIERE